MSAPGWADMPPQDLTPASGRQDHTILPSATTSLVRVLVIAHSLFKNPPCDPIARSTLPRPPHPAPNVRDDHDTPLSRAGIRKVLEMIWGARKGKYFCKWDSTRLSTNRPTGKSPDRPAPIHHTILLIGRATSRRRPRLRCRRRARTSLGPRFIPMTPRSAASPPSPRGSATKPRRTRSWSAGVSSAWSSRGRGRVAE
jgi:hypothetical protein